MDTLLAGHRSQKQGPVSEAVIATERETGQVEIDYAVFDDNYTSTAVKEAGELEGLVSRSFITIPAAVMGELVKGWNARHPQGYKEDEWTPLADVRESETIDSPAAGFAQQRLSASSSR